MDTNQRIRELADMFQLTKTKSGTWTFDLPPIRTGGPLPYMPSDQGVYETDSEGRVTYRETIEHLALPADKRGAVIALCEWYALHAVDSNYELYCDDNENVYKNTEAREEIKFRLSSAYAILVESGAYEEAMNGLDWAEKARYESIVDEINGLINVMPINAMTAAN